MSKQTKQESDHMKAITEGAVLRFNNRMIRLAEELREMKQRSGKSFRGLGNNSYSIATASWILRLLDGSKISGIKLKTLGHLAIALGYELKIEFVPLNKE